MGWRVSYGQHFSCGAVSFLAFSQQIVPSLNALFANLDKESLLGNLPASKFCSRAAHYMGELNAIHPFREGNGRTQREFIRQLALRNGYTIDWTRIARDQMTEASKLSFQRADNSGLERVLDAALHRERTCGYDRDDDR